MANNSKQVRRFTVPTVPPQNQFYVPPVTAPSQLQVPVLNGQNQVGHYTTNEYAAAQGLLGLNKGGRRTRMNRRQRSRKSRRRRYKF
jgi:hypothetical protein